MIIINTNISRSIKFSRNKRSCGRISFCFSNHKHSTCSSRQCKFGCCRNYWSVKNCFFRLVNILICINQKTTKTCLYKKSRMCLLYLIIYWGSSVPYCPGIFLVLSFIYLCLWFLWSFPSNKIPVNFTLGSTEFLWYYFQF